MEREHISGSRRGGPKRCLCQQKGNMRDTDHETVLKLDCKGGYVNVNMLKNYEYIELNMSAHV